jgi:hypothetical protein
MLIRLERPVFRSGGAFVFKSGMSLGGLHYITISCNPVTITVAVVSKI